MNSRLKAAPTITLSERGVLRFSWVRTELQEVTVALGVNWRITGKQKDKKTKTKECWREYPLNIMAFYDTAQI